MSGNNTEKREMSGAKKRYYARKRKRRKRNMRIFLTVLILLIVAATTAAVLIFSDTQEIKASGSSIYKSEDIVKASKIQTGKSLFSFKKDDVKQNIEHTLPYIGEVKVSRKLFTKVEIKVKDTKAAYIGEFNGKYYYINEAGKVLSECPDISQKESGKRLPVIYGLDIKELKTGYVPEFNNSIIIENLNGVFEFFALDKNGFVISPSDVRYINLYEDYQITFWYKDYLLVNIGLPEILPKKKDALRQIIEKTSKTELASVDLSLLGKNKEAYRNILPELEVPPDSIQYAAMKKAEQEKASGEITDEVSQEAANETEN